MTLFVGPIDSLRYDRRRV